jgi:hypothetical protein
MQSPHHTIVQSPMIARASASTASAGDNITRRWHRKHKVG